MTQKHDYFLPSESEKLRMKRCRKEALGVSVVYKCIETAAIAGDSLTARQAAVRSWCKLYELLCGLVGKVPAAVLSYGCSMI